MTSQVASVSVAAVGLPAAAIAREGGDELAHLAVLEAANLVTVVHRGREKLHYLTAEPINAIADRWISHYDRERVRALADLKQALETTPVKSNAFVYTTSRVSHF